MISHCVQLNALFSCLWRNVEASCHKHFVVYSGYQHRHLQPAMCHNLRHAGRGPPATAFTTPACCSVNTGISQVRYRFRIAISAYPTCIRRPLRGEVPVGILLCRLARKTKMAWLSDGEKNWFYVYSFRQNPRTWHTHTHTHTHT